MKSKNRGISKTTEKSLTCTSSIETSQPTIHATSKRFWNRNKTLASLCLAVVCVVALLPLLAVNSYAAEPDVSSQTETPSPPLLPDIPEGYSDYFPTWLVSTYVASYSTASKAGVYAYITSPNAPKASTRVATVDYTPDLTLTTRLFIFKDFDATDPLNQRNISISADVFDRIGDTERYSFTSPISQNTRFVFSNDCRLEYRLTVMNTDLSSEAYFEVAGNISYTAAPNPDISRVGVDIADIYADARTKISGSYDSLVCTHIELLVNPVWFDNASPFSSWCDVLVVLPSNEQTSYYSRSVGEFLLNYHDATTYYNELGYISGEIVGYEKGYSNGRSDGINIGVASNFEPGWFVRGVDAFLNVRLFQFAVGDNLVDFTLGTILSITLGGTALIWFLKLFAGG